MKVRPPNCQSHPKAAASHWSLDSLRAPAQPVGTLPNTDPIARAARYNALTTAESMVDGLGGTPTPLGSAFEANPLNNLGASRRRFRVGPVNLIGPSFTVAASEENFTTRGSQATGTNSSSNQAGADGMQGFQSTAGASLGLTLGEPATGHYLGAQYGAVYRYPTNGSGGGANATGSQPFNQQLSMLGEMDFAKLKLGFGISFASLSGMNRDAGGDVNRQLLDVSLTSSYEWTPQDQPGLGSRSPSEAGFRRHRLRGRDQYDVHQPSLQR